MSDLATTIPDRLRELRLAAGLTAAQVADRAGTSLYSVLRWERGERQPRLAQLDALAAALGVAVAELVRPATTRQEPRGRGRPRPSRQQEKETTR